MEDALRQGRDVDALGAVIGATLFGSDVVGRAHAFAPLKDLTAMQFAAVDVMVESADTWTNPRVILQALKFLLGRDLLTPAQVQALAAQYRSAGLSIAGVTDEQMLQVAKDALLRAVNLKYSLEAATQELQTALTDQGFTALRPWHARLVAHMNSASAYNRGQHDVLADPRLRGIIPAYRYVTRDDDAVRPTHAAMHDKVFARDDAIWQIWWPPAGFGCRCRVVGVPAAQWQGQSAEWPTVLGHDVHPDEGFGGPPGQFQVDAAGARADITMRRVNNLARRLQGTGYTVPDGARVVAVFSRGN